MVNAPINLVHMVTPVLPFCFVQLTELDWGHVPTPWCFILRFSGFFIQTSLLEKLLFPIDSNGKTNQISLDLYFIFISTHSIFISRYYDFSISYFFRHDLWPSIRSHSHSYFDAVFALLVLNVTRFKLGWRKMGGNFHLEGFFGISHKNSTTKMARTLFSRQASQISYSFFISTFFRFFIFPPLMAYIWNVFVHSSKWEKIPTPLKDIFVCSNVCDVPNTQKKSICQNYHQIKKIFRRKTHTEIKSENCFAPM